MIIPRCNLGLASLTSLLLLAVGVQAAPQHYDNSFIKTNISKSIHHPHHFQRTLNDHPDSHRGGSHRHASSTVQTSSGPLKGLKRAVLGKEVHVYYGVPFAKPPLDELRFKKPVPVEPWNTTFNAFHQPNTCFQEVFEVFPDFKGEMVWLPNTNISEDCLYMNIWAPKPKKHPTKPKKMPIMVWMYGGGYVSGTAALDIYNAEILAAENDVVVVVPQYRVGAFGFLYFGEEDAPGNVGLHDQVLALEWIKENAAKFGGDPESITIFGESAGGGSVTFHLLSPYSRHLIDRGIIQSGTINAPWSIMSKEKARQIAEKLVRDLNCTNPDGSPMNTKQKIACLRDMEAKNISVVQWNSYDKILQFFSGPTIDGDFLPKDPMEMLKEGDFKKVPLLIGSNKDEGSYFILYDFIDNFTKDGPNCQDKKFFTDVVSHVFPNVSIAKKEAIKFQYTHWEDREDPCKIRDKFLEFVGDYYFICPTNRFAETYAAHGAPVYYYFFTQRTSSNPWGDWMGVLHADEIEYVFGIPLNNSKAHTWAEQQLSRKVMRHFASFAETGECSTPESIPAEPESPQLQPSSSIPEPLPPKAPTFGPSAGGVNSVTSSSTPHYFLRQWNPVYDPSEEWPLYTKSQPNYYILNAENKGTGKGPRAQACAFWNEFMPQLTPEAGGCNRLFGEISGASQTTFSWVLMGGVTAFLILMLNIGQLSTSSSSSSPLILYH